MVTENTGSFFTIRAFAAGGTAPGKPPDVTIPEPEYDPENEDDAREIVLRAVAARRGQPAFRAELLKAYKGRCAISGTSTVSVLEAAHIQRYQGKYTNHVTNGLLLRADLHTLYDLGLLSVDPRTFKVHLAPEVRDSEYTQYEGAALRLPDDEKEWPNRVALSKHSGV